MSGPLTEDPTDPTDPTAATDAPVGEEPGTPASSALSPADRAAAFATGQARVDRAAALRAGTVPVPGTFVRWVIVGFAVLALGGIVGEKLIGNAGVGALDSTPVTTLAGAGASPSPAPGGSTAPATPAPPTGPLVSASPAAVIGLVHAAGRTAPPLALDDQHGSPWSLDHAKGKVVVVTFFNSECNDLCPVLAREITEADRLLGPRRAEVMFVVVNSDPLETSPTPAPPALTRTGLSALANVTFLDGSLTQLSRVWRSYGITVAVDNTDRVVTHNDVMDFIDRAGKVVLSASPFANESSAGTYSLQPTIIHTFAQGVATSASGLVKGMA